MFCGYVLAHLGAEVIAVEPPGGSTARRQPPFRGDTGEPEDGLWWQAYARGKSSCVLDLASAEGRGRFAELAADADFVIESFGSADARALGVDYETLSARNPALIVVSISPFGRTGPKADWPATDLTVWAASGAQILAGDSDRAPVRTSVPQSFLHAGADAAAAALIALQERHVSGLGQHVDVSAQQSSAQAALAANLGAPNNAGFTVQRIAGGLAGRFPIQLTWPCADGYVAITLLFGPAFTEPNRRLLGWVHEGGACTREDVDTDWGLALASMMNDDASPEPYFELCRKIERFTRSRTQQELFEEGLERGVYIAPAFDVAGLLEERQFRERDFWTGIEVAPAVSARVPGAFARLSATPLTLPGRAPRLGEMSGGARRTTPLPSATGAAPSLPLAGLKVVDFMWVIAGPLFTRVLADYGATVIKVESSVRLDPGRALRRSVTASPGRDGVPFASFNTGKMSLTVDPSNPVGREVLLDLVRWADVVSESFSPKAMQAWGLDYASLREVNPSLIMLSSCLMGQTGPRARVPGYGNMAAALAGVLRPHRLAGPFPGGAVPGLYGRRLSLGSCWPPCSGRWNIAAGPARGSTSTSRRPRRPFTCSRRPFSTARSTGASGIGWGTATSRCAHTAPTPPAARIAGWRSPASPMSRGARCVRPWGSRARLPIPLLRPRRGAWPGPTNSTR